jgi:hypothetical protein
MFNRMQGGGAHIPQNNSISNPQQVSPAANQQGVTLPPAAVSQASRPPVGRPHHSNTAQRLANAFAPNRAGRERNAAPPLVGPNTTVLDIVSWNSQANLNGIRAALVLGKEQQGGDPRLGHAQVNVDTQIQLSFQTDPSKPADRTQVLNARQAALTILANTAHAYQLQGTPAGEKIAEARLQLTAPDYTLTAGAFSTMMKNVGESVHIQTMHSLPASRAERDTKRMPMDCLTHLGHQMRAAQPSASPEQQALLETLGAEAKDRALRHNLSFGSTRTWLDSVAARCEQQGLDELAGLARELHNAVPEPAPHDREAEQLRNHAAQLHDNIYGRALESVMINELVLNTPAEVKTSMMALSTHLDHALSNLSPDWQQYAAAGVQHMMRHESRSWQNHSPALSAFIGAAPADALPALRALLAAPKDNGADCMAVPYLTVKLSLCMQSGAPWMAAANDNYLHVVQAASARETEAGTNANRVTPKSGITAHHQPIMAWTAPHEASMHPGDKNRPLLDKPSPELMNALQHGAPFVSGVSGSTNIVMHAVASMPQGTINAKDALLGTMMFLTHDGGHSMHEAMWVGNQLDSRLGLGMGMPGGHAPGYVADYQAFMDSFPDGQCKDTMHAASDRAWHETLNHFGTISHHSPDNPIP